MLGRSTAALACALLPAMALAAGARGGARGKPATKPAAKAANPAALDPGKAGKPVPFDARWLTPYFAQGAAAAAAERFRLEDWKGAAAGFEKVASKLRPS